MLKKNLLKTLIKLYKMMVLKYKLTATKPLIQKELIKVISRS